MAICAIGEENCFEEELKNLNSTTIFPRESKKINNFVFKLENISNGGEKLKQISDFTQADFIWMLNNESFQNEDRFRSYFSILFYGGPDFLGHYISDKEGHRVIRAGKYQYNPYIISYYKAGACGEHQALAEFLANQSQFTVRKVGDPSGYHAWLEIYSDGIWYFYDPTIPTSYNISSWFEKRENYQNSPVIRNAGRVFFEKDDVTHLYSPYGKLSISGIYPGDRLSINWGDEKKKYSYEVNSDCNKSISINLIPKKYSLKIVRLYLFTNTIEFSIRPNEETSVDLSKLFINRVVLPNNIEKFYSLGQESRRNLRLPV